MSASDDGATIVGQGELLNRSLRLDANGARIAGMTERSALAIMLLVGSGVLQAQCVPGPNYHCVEISGLAYVPNVLTVIEGDTVEFAASSFHPLRQVINPVPSTTPVPGGLSCEGTPCIRMMGVRQMPAFHFICTNHIQAVMRGDITILPRALFAGGFED